MNDGKTDFKDKGRLFLVSAPSGAGKTTLCKALLERFTNIRYSVSSTTRKPRTGERNGIDYHFVSKEDFVKGIENGGWAEWAKVHDNYYGTSSVFLDKALAVGDFILLDIDVQGARQILEHYPDSISFFIMPPSIEALRSRLEKRDSDSPEAIEKRLGNAVGEMAGRQIYRYIILNDRLEPARLEFISIVEKYIRGC